MELRIIELLMTIIIINPHIIQGEIKISATSSHSMPDETVTGIILGASVAIFFIVLIVVVCVKEKCNQRRSVYHKKSKKSIDSKSDVHVENGISTISQSIRM